jgi:hypothetical protein
MADWVGGASRMLDPLVEVLRRHVMSTATLHADDTPLPVLSPGKGKTATGRFWTYVRDGRPAGDTAPPAAWFTYSPDRKGEHPVRHLQHFEGVLQADAYAGFNRVYADGKLVHAACWAHVRRKFVDVHEAHRSPVALEVLRRIGELYDIEREIQVSYRRSDCECGRNGRVRGLKTYCGIDGFSCGVCQRSLRWRARSAMRWGGGRRW